MHHAADAVDGRERVAEDVFVFELDVKRRLDQGNQLDDTRGIDEAEVVQVRVAREVRVAWRYVELITDVPLQDVRDLVSRGSHQPFLSAPETGAETCTRRVARSDRETSRRRQRTTG